MVPGQFFGTTELSASLFDVKIFKIFITSLSAFILYGYKNFISQSKNFILFVLFKNFKIISI
jgi:hypothetical protein